MSLIAGTGYVNLSMFFAFAMLYPDTQFLVFFIIPVKVKWLAWIDAAFFALSVLSSLVRLDIAGALLPLVALLNFFVFFWTNISDEIAYRRGRSRYQTSHQTIHFKSAVRQQKKRKRLRATATSARSAAAPTRIFRTCSSGTAPNAPATIASVRTTSSAIPISPNDPPPPPDFFRRGSFFSPFSLPSRRRVRYTE